ncbi:hypothetical protein COCVIDRAFT_84969 [Bipolaris victoriae FI3]|uniref:Uncharacterized protein n=1 Tax=Bipolaris victoriae (strain FI3) TaxID=930091 RepID=W7F3H1_BIPV3|nr:hypothetical protein COCVIDRAFT_84969 [Bipolaris victoriae FI3]
MDPLDPNFVTHIRKVNRGGVHAAAILSGSVKAYESGLSIIRIGGKLMVVGVVSTQSGLSLELAFPTFS